MNESDQKIPKVSDTEIMRHYKICMIFLLINSLKLLGIGNLFNNRFEKGINGICINKNTETDYQIRQP